MSALRGRLGQLGDEGPDARLHLGEPRLAQLLQHALRGHLRDLELVADRHPRGESAAGLVGAVDDPLGHHGVHLPPSRNLRLPLHDPEARRAYPYTRDQTSYTGYTAYPAGVACNCTRPP